MTPPAAEAATAPSRAINPLVAGLLLVLGPEAGAGAPTWEWAPASRWAWGWRSEAPGSAWPSGSAWASAPAWEGGPDPDAGIALNRFLGLVPVPQDPGEGVDTLHTGSEGRIREALIPQQREGDGLAFDCYPGLGQVGALVAEPGGERFHDLTEASPAHRISQRNRA